MVLQNVPIAPRPEPVYQSTYLIVSADHDDAVIYIDGEEVGVKEAQKRFEVGSTHTWKIECEFYHSESGSVTLKEKTEINKTLQPNFGYINITTSPEQGAKVLVDGKLIGESPVVSDRLISGTHTVKVIKDMYKTTEHTFTVNDGQTTEANVEMDADFATLTVNTDTDSDIYIDDEYKGKGRWSGRITEGTHVVEARKLNHKPSVKTINIVLGKDEELNLESPLPINGSLDISSKPMRADIFIDGKAYGQTPNYINEIIIGKHELKLTKQGCATSIISINITEGETLKIDETLQTGKEITITTGQNGDKIYVDNEYVGLSPLTANISYGKHEIKAVRGSQTATKDIDVAISSGKQEYVLAFGKMIMINSSANGDEIYVDGKKVGTTPMNVDLSLGNHDIEVRRGKLYDKRNVRIAKDSPVTYTLRPSVENYLNNGIKFLTVNAAYSVAPQTSYGLTYGQVKKFGWFVSAMTNFGFRFGANEWEELYSLYSSDEAIISGNSSKARLSLTGGLLLRLGGPVYMKLGAGYGVRVKCWELSSGGWYEFTPDTYRGVDLTAGLMFNTNGCAISADVVTTNFKTIEFKLGVGINWN